MNSYRGTKSPVSLAFLNDDNDAEYIFYKDHPHDRLDYVTPEINRDDIVMIGSYYAVNPRHPSAGGRNTQRRARPRSHHLL